MRRVGTALANLAGIVGLVVIAVVEVLDNRRQVRREPS